MFQRARASAVALALSVVAVAPVAPGAASADEPPAAPGCSRLAVVGDSLTVGSGRATVTALTSLGIRNFALDGRRGRQIRATAKYSGVRTVRDLRADGFDADCFVVALGTNDVMTTTSALKYAAFIEEMLAEIGDHPVLWVDVVNGKHPARALVFDLLLEAATAAHPNLLVARWSDVMAVHPEWTSRDQVHLRAAGYQARGEWLAGQVLSRLYGTPPDDTTSCTITRRLRYRTRHPEVACLEHRLAQLGYPFAGPPDDLFDRATYRALVRFQKWHLLGPSGITSPSTVAALGLTGP